MSTTTDAQLSLINDAECLGELGQVAAAEPFGRNEDIPFVAAALVIAACLTVGAATAGFLLHDRLVQITAISANR
jgi:hypothetical protein